MGERRGEYWVLVWKPKGKSSLGTPRHRWKNNIKMDLRDVEWILIIKPTRCTNFSKLF
jgi:hypothetical protein